MKNIRKFAAILAAIVTVTSFQLTELFAQGAVVGYAWGGRAYYENIPINNLPTNGQLEKLTHVMAVDLYFDANGSLTPNPDPSINNFQSWLDDLAERAQQRIAVL